MCVSDLKGDVTAQLGPLRLERIAHGGYCVGRHDGRVIFVRRGIPGELVTVSITDSAKAKYWFGEVVEVLEPSPNRVEVPCPVFAECGGCDFQHMSYLAQLESKRQVVAEQLQRLAGISWDGEVITVDEGHGSHLGWRTRMDYWAEIDTHASDGVARVGLRRARSHSLVDLSSCGCLLAAPAGPTARDLCDVDARRIRVATNGVDVSVVADGRVVSGPADLVQRVDDRDYVVSAQGFWQVHPRAAEVLVEAVMRGLSPTAGELALDLYCGVGLFAGMLERAGCDVVGIEVSPDAIEYARRNVPEARFYAGKVERNLGRLKEADIIVLDPPRKGAGERVTRHLAGLRPRAVAYVACDPAALARDLNTWQQCGYGVEWIEAFDLFPMTHHVECVCLMTRRG